MLIKLYPVAIRFISTVSGLMRRNAVAIADPDKRTRTLFQHTGKVLRSHVGCYVSADCVRPHHARRHLDRNISSCRIIMRHRQVVYLVQFDLGPIIATTPAQISNIRTLPSLRASRKRLRNVPLIRAVSTITLPTVST